MKPRLNFYQAGPKAMRPMLELEAAVRGSGIDPKLLHLIKLRASQLNGCAFCLDMHAHEARADGESQQRLDVLSAWAETDLFDEREQAALAWTEALTLVADTHAPDHIYDRFAAAFDEKERVAISLAIVTINAWNRLAIGFRSIPSRRG
ncbi:carboxymuconolactone decarboxylase family protein [Sphingomonas sp.]|uniref:carboxymuconolactone decarboxylase family protein n=1 Tax=Sphingomonas sp. TaxID=28214 RepID=UPI002DE8D264|nr:carboxymuconolactone decarboxylase family protein [Sphingomonas sp.]